MTRKRYVKLIMSLGKQRNEAEALATAARLLGRTYEEDFQARKPWIQIGRAFDGLSSSFRLFGESVSNAAKAIQKLFQQ